MRQIILDTETTGLEASQGHRIIEIVGLEMLNRKLTGRYIHFYCHPERDIDPEAERVHGISLDFLADKPRFSALAPEIIDFISDAELIIHNAVFDLGFLNAEFERVDLPRVETLCAGVIDTLTMARELFPGKRNSLDALCDRYGIDRSERVRHGALIDCELLAEVYLSMTRGQESFAIEIDLDERHEELGAGSLPFERKPINIIYPSNEEREAHARYLTELDNCVNGICVWRQFSDAGTRAEPNAAAKQEPI